MKKVNVKEFVKNHKKAIVMGVAGVGLTAGGVIIFKNVRGVIKTAAKEVDTLRPDVLINDAFLTVEYADGKIGVLKDSTGVIERLVDSGLMDVHQVAEALEYLTPKMD